MPLPEPVTPGVVDWTGDNPGILLYDDDGSFSAMALFFRVAWSAAGQGQVLLLYGCPQQRVGTPEAPNVLMGDNEALANYLKDHFIGKLPAFRDTPAYSNPAYLNATAVRASGDLSRRPRPAA